MALLQSNISATFRFWRAILCLSLHITLDSFWIPTCNTLRSSINGGGSGYRSPSVLVSAQSVGAVQIYRDTGRYSLTSLPSNNVSIAGTLSFIEFYADKSDGSYAALAWDMFVAWANLNGSDVILPSDPSDPYTFRVLYVDDYSDTDVVVATYNSMVSKYDFFLSPIFDNLTVAAIDIAEQNNKVLISAHTLGTDIFQGRDKSFSMLPSDDWHHEIGFQTFAPFSPESIAVIRDTSFRACADPSKSQAFGTMNNYSQVYHYEVDGTNITAVTEIMRLLKENDVSVVYGCTHSDLCVTGIAAAKAVGYSPAGMMFSYCLDSPEFYTLGEDTRYVVLATPWVDTLNIRCKYTGWTPKEFSERYYTYGNKIPSYYVAGTFAGGLVLRAAIEAAGSLNTQLVANKIKSMSFETLYGNVSFDENNQAILDFIAVQMRNSTYYELINGTNLQYPMPTWAAKQCQVDTYSCSGNGYCSDTGTCICNPGYYNSMGKCDAFCPGEIANTSQGVYFCKQLKKLYLGVMGPVGFYESAELSSAIRLAADLINNKTDGWFDDSTRQVEFVLNMTEFKCSEENGRRYAEYLSQWAKDNGQSNLNGIIGAYCSSASAEASKYGGVESIPQISYSASSVTLSDKNTYPLFFRTCLSDDKQSGYLKSFLMDYGMTYVAVISTSDLYSATLAKAFTEAFSGAGGTLLYVREYDVAKVNQSTFYTELISELIASGSPVILTSTVRTEAANIFAAAKVTYPDLLGPKYLWLAVDEWVDTDDVEPPLGTVGLGPNSYEPGEPYLGDKFVELWETADPVKYQDADGNRSTLFTYSASAADAVFALAVAYQGVINSNFQGSEVEFRRQVGNYLFNSIEMVGLTGTVRFDANGDRELARYVIKNYQYGHWVSVGLTELSGGENSEGINIDDSALIYPNGKTMSSGNYSQQYKPVCQPGFEPVDSNGNLICSPCNVGFYKPDVGPYDCYKCPEGADCDDRGIDIPNILPKYWRQNPPTQEAKGDFYTYRIYRCDVDKNCIGGADLTNLCASNIDPNYPVCGVCLDGYYFNSDNDCVECQGDDAFITGMEILMSFIVITLVAAFLYLLHSSRLDSISSSETILSKADSITNLTDVSADVKINAQESSSTTTNSSSNENGSQKATSRLSLQVAVAQSVSQFLRAAKSHGAFVTVKLTVSFVQVLAGALLAIKVEWKSGISNLLSLIKYDPLESVSLFSGCKSTPHLGVFYSRQLLILFAPIAFVAMTFIVNRVVLFVNIRSGHISGNNIDVAKGRLMDISIKALVWFCLFFYPILASGSLNYFNCRFLGELGTYAREDYSIECEGDYYDGFTLVAVLNVLIYPIGIPIFFYLLIRDRYKPWALVASVPLHSNFTHEWAYYEVFELFRKLLLTSVVGFVAPGTASQCLFLFAVDIVALLILSLCRPYAFDADDFLSGIMTLFECIIFMISFLIVSEVHSTDNYSFGSMMDMVFSLILIALVVLVPINIIYKIPYLKTRISMAWGYIQYKTHLHMPEEVSMLIMGLDARGRYKRESEDFRASMSIGPKANEVGKRKSRRDADEIDSDDDDFDSSDSKGGRVSTASNIATTSTATNTATATSPSATTNTTSNSARARTSRGKKGTAAELSDAL